MIGFTISLIPISKAQHTTVYGPSAFKSTPLAAFVPGLGSDYTWEHQVVRIAHAGSGAVRQRQQLSTVPDTGHYVALGSSGKASAPVDPVVIQSFKANVYNGYTPADNSVAVSNDGIIVSAINSNIYYYRADGTELGNTTFLRLSRDYFSNLKSGMFDPRVMYDRSTDRFVMVILNGHESSTSELLVLFSVSNNPMDGWNGYLLPGDMLEKDQWMDYPNIAVNQSTLFVSVNMYDDNGDFKEPLVIGIEKKTGYAGNELNYQYWQGLMADGEPAFTVVPVEQGSPWGFSNRALFTCTNDYYNNYLEIYELNPSTNELTAFDVEVMYYDVPNEGDQLGTTDQLNLGDNRTKHAIVIDQVLHVVHTTATINYHSAVNYYRVDLKTRKVDTKTLHRDAKKMGLSFPTIASAGTTPGDQSVIIAFTQSSKDIYPELAVLSIDHELNVGNMVVVQEGSGYVDVLRDEVERWGDYITLARRYNTNTCWLFGLVGGPNGRFDNYLFEMSLNGQVGTGPGGTPTKSAVYPNPAVEATTLEFDLNQRRILTIAVYDMAGKQLQVLSHDAYGAGQHRIILHTNQLPPGHYIIKVFDREALISQGQFVKQ